MEQYYKDKFILNDGIIDLEHIPLCKLMKLCNLPFDFVPNVPLFTYITINDVECKVWLSHEQMTKCKEQVWTTKAMQFIVHHVPDIAQQVEDWLNNLKNNKSGNFGNVIYNQRVWFEWPPLIILCGLKMYYPLAKIEKFM